MNVDFDPTCADLVCDIRKLELPDCHADAIAAIHVVEHIYRWEVDAMLRDWHRVLKPGGDLILELPCMEKVISYLVKAVKNHQPISPTYSWFPMWGDPKYKNEGMVHRWGYTSQMLRELLVRAGFKGIKLEEPNYHFPQRDMRMVAVK